MILFKPKHVPMILSGRKTRTVRTWKKRKAKPGSIHKAKLNMTSQRYFAKIRFLEVYQDYLGVMSDQDIYDEGYDSMEEFQEAFKEIYGFWDPMRLVWIGKFELIESAGWEKNE